jgi:hypothetical protein
MASTGMSNTHPVVTIDVVRQLNTTLSAFSKRYMNTQVLDRHTTKEVLRAILHSILFHRLFGTVKPKTFEVLDITMPGVADPETESMVNEKVDAFWKAIEGGSDKRGQVSQSIRVFTVISLSRWKSLSRFL